MSGAIVQQASGTSTTGSVTLGTGGSAFGSNVTSGNVLHVVVGSSGTASQPSWTFSNSGTCTLGTPVQISCTTDYAASDRGVCQYYIPITGSGTCVLSGTVSGQTVANGLYAAEVTGLAATPITSGQYAQSTDTYTGSGGANSLTTGNTPTLATSSSFPIAFCYNVGGTGTAAAGTTLSWTTLSSVWGGSGIAEYITAGLSGTSAIAATFNPPQFTNCYAVLAVYAVASNTGATSGSGVSTTSGAGALTALIGAVGLSVTIGAAALTGALAGSGVSATVGSGALSLQGGGPGISATVGAGSLTGAGALGGSGVCPSVGAGALTGSGALAGSGVSIAIGSGDLEPALAGSTSGSGTSATVGAGALTGAGALAGIGASASIGAAGASAQIGGSGIAASAGAADLEPYNAGATSGSGVGATVGAGALTGSGALGGSGVSPSIGSGDLEPYAPPAVQAAAAGGSLPGWSGEEGDGPLDRPGPKMRPGQVFGEEYPVSPWLGSQRPENIVPIGGLTPPFHVERIPLDRLYLAMLDEQQLAVIALMGKLL